jgi:prophage regulatory protein
VTTLQRILREPEVLRATGYKRTQLQELIDRGVFPRPIALSPGGRARGWIESEVAEYQAARIAERDGHEDEPSR